MKKEKILLIDANALIHRAYHALPPLTTKNGEMINAVYGFALMLLKTMNELKPDYIAAAFDRPEPTFRHKEYKEYKATRQRADQELINQFPKIKELVECINIPIFEKAGFEADDIVGTLAKKANEKNVEAIIVTGDLDEVQLVSENTKVYTMRRGFTDTVLYDIKQTKEKFGGLLPDQVVDYKALRGDPSDNIPGVSGIGEKGAIELIKNFKNIENIYKAIDENSKELSTIKPRTLEALIDHKKEAITSKHLAKIIIDMPLELNLEKAAINHFNRDKAVEVFKKYEFRTLISKLPKSNEIKDKKIDFKVNIISTKEELQLLIARLEKQQEFVIDTETESLDCIDAKIIGLSIAFSEEEGFYVPCKESYWKELKPILENKEIMKIGHNLKYDYNVFQCSNINLYPLYFDTMIAYYLLNPGERRLSLDDLAFSELSYEKIKIEGLIGKGKNQKKCSEVPLEVMAEYACEDAVITYRLYKKASLLIAKEHFENLLFNIEMPLVPILATIEKNGVKIDIQFLKNMSSKLEKNISNLQKKICKLADCDFNINSPQQLKEILFDKLNLAADPLVRRNMKKLKSGGFSTASNILEKLKNTHPIIQLIFEHRELSKLKNTYTDAIPKLVHPATGRVHTNFNQTITATGRLSSSNPNLQNIPIRTKIGREIRKGFIAEKGFRLIAADYSQIELRIIAHLSKDKAMTDAFNNREDIHAKTASLVNEVNIKDITYDQRRAAKAVNFGIVYGISAHGLAEQLGWAREEAQFYIDKYYEKHPGVIRYMEQTIEDAKENGYVETFFGRKRYLPELFSSNFQIRAQAERMAINFPAQGTAADLMKMAMIDVSKSLCRISSKAKIILQVHDELVLEVPDKEVKKVTEFLKTTMEKAYSDFAIPIQVDISSGNDWKDMVRTITEDKSKNKEV